MARRTHPSLLPTSEERKWRVGRPPVRERNGGRDARVPGGVAACRWKGATGLAADVRYYGVDARQGVGTHRASLSHPQRETVIAWI
ncbi:MAG: hypothetical protein R3E79_24085 [Caldilineaceae bacterium]